MISDYHTTLTAALTGAGNLAESRPLPEVINAPLKYRRKTGVKPAMAAGDSEIDESFEWKTVAIADGRAVRDQLSLDGEGFALQSHETAVTNFADEETLRRIYYPEAEQLVKAATGASRVIVFDHTIRLEDELLRDARAVRGPVQVVHNDYTEVSGPRRVRDLLEPNDARRFLEHRFAIVNVWRSIAGAVERMPLAAADARSITLEDFIATDLVRPDRTGEIYQVAYNPNQRWFYFPKMQPDEALLLKCYDSATDGPARFTAHTAFDDPTAAHDAPPRESIELRTLVSYAPLQH